MDGIINRTLVRKTLFSFKNNHSLSAWMAQLHARMCISLGFDFKKLINPSACMTWLTALLRVSLDFDLKN